MNQAILFDTETTGLHEITAAPLDRQPHIIEVGARKVDWDTLETLDEMEFLVNPGVPIPAKVTEITGLTDADVAAAKRFAAWILPLSKFFLGTFTLVGHNLPYDVQMMIWELMRLDMVAKFPWPLIHICTVERSQDLTGKYQSLTDLYIHYYGTNPNQQHRGMGDVDILHEVVKAMRKEGRL